MKGKVKETEIKSGQRVNKTFKDLYGMEPEMSLLSANFAPPENNLLNENYLEDSNVNE
ncbi:hypothetical protein V7111_19085 [Neobacillus niacini]|uniref:hypothetical protein n=1 Tax=Neobacillus niacini TaxID=86668 RepID=UPI003001CAC5